MGKQQREEDKTRRYNIDLRGLPADLEAEKGLLSCLLYDADKWLPEVDQHITEHTMTLAAHRSLFRMIQTMVAAGERVDELTVKAAYGTPSNLERELGSFSYLMDISDRGHRHTNPVAYAIALREMERKRDTMTMLHEAVAALGNLEIRVDTLIPEIEQELLRVMHGGPAKPRTPEEILRDTLEELSEVRNKSKENVVPGLTWGVGKLDELTTGIRRGEYEVIGGRTGDGKTALACQGAISNAMAGHKPVIMSVELRATDMMLRLISNHARIDYTLLRDPKMLDKETYRMVTEAGGEIARTGLVIDECGGMNLPQVEARLRLHAMRGAEVAYFDYLQKLKVPRGMTRYDFFTEASDTICKVAKSTGMPIVMLSQLSRPQVGKFRPTVTPRPTLYDFKESGQVENDAFCAIGIYRPQAKDGSDTGEDELIVMKQRNGSKGRVDVEYIGKHLRFQEVNERT